MNSFLTRIRVTTLLMICGACLNGCGTIMLGTTQGIPVTSNPPGVRVTVDGYRRGVTPLKLRLKKNSHHTIRLDKDGYQPVVIEIANRRGPEAGGTIAGDILLGFISGAVAGGFAGYQILGGDNGTEILNASLGALVGGVAFPLIFLSIDSHNKGTYVLSPEELIVTMSKIGGQERLQYIRLDTDRINGIRWIRLACDDSIVKHSP